MKNRLYVGNLPFSIQEDSLSEVFSEGGPVSSVRIITDPATGRSKGFGFVDMETEESASQAIETMNGKEIEGRTLRVDYAREREPRPRGPRR